MTLPSPRVVQGIGVCLYLIAATPATRMSGMDYRLSPAVLRGEADKLKE
jgi:hypothetical protein